MMCLEIDKFNHKFLACGGVDRIVYLYNLELDLMRDNDNNVVTKVYYDCMGHDG